MEYNDNPKRSMKGQRIWEMTIWRRKKITENRLLRIYLAAICDEDLLFWML